MSFLKGLLKLLDLALLLIDWFKQEKTKQAGRDEVALETLERDREGARIADAIDREVAATPLTDLQRRMLKYRRGE